MQAIVTASSVNVRSGPSTSKKWLGRLNKGDSFTYSNDQNGWLQTEYNNQTAYVCKKYTSTTSGSTPAAPTTEASTASEPASTPAASTPAAQASINVSAAVSYNKKRGYSKAKWMEIQSKVGETADGIPGAKTAQAIANWQLANNLKADGKCGPGTLAAMNLDGSTPSTPTTTTTPSTPTTTTTPSTPTTTTAPSTPTTTTAPSTPTTSTPSTPTTSEPVSAGEKILSSKQVDSAIDYNIGQNITSVWKEIQAVVGTAQTGKIDETSVQAIAVWQRDNGLEADGKFGKKSFAKAGLTKPSSSGSVAYGTTGPGGLVYADNNYVRKNQDPSTEKEVVDLKTGKKFKIFWRAPSNTYHSDVNPWDKTSTDTYKSLVNPNVSPDDKNYWSKGSHWSWKGHPGALKLNSNTWISCGFHTRPHGSRQGANPDYPFTQSSANNRPSGTTSEDDWRPGGHFCLYYNETNRGGTKGCKEAAEQAKNMQCPE